MRDTATAASTDVVLGEDWVAPDHEIDSELAGLRKRRKSAVLKHSPLARRIITFNLLALIVLVAGVLYLNPFRDTLVAQRQVMLGVEARLLAELFEAGLPGDFEIGPTLASKREARRVLGGIEHRGSAEAYLFDLSGELVASSQGSGAPTVPASTGESTPITDLLKAIWSGMSAVLRPNTPVPQPPDPAVTARALAEVAARSGTLAYDEKQRAGGGVVASAAPVMRDGAVVGVVALASYTREIDALVQAEREQVLQVFFTAILVSIALSLVLASTIANPLADLASAAEMGRDRDARKMSPSRVRIPDLTARPDEIGRLSGALRGMVAALYDRIEANEQFAADVAHEIKNPLASLRSAVGTLRLTQRDDQRLKLLDVVEHDVRRLDRLISDISNASRLDAELVKEEEAPFDLLKMLSNISTHFRQEAGQRGVEFITDLPTKPIIVNGLEARVAQVFVNLISNAVSFCDDGDAVRVWTRRRENRVLVVVEDTGPGIPEEALQKIFKRFYSERPAGQFGKHSGLGLAISKQIVEAHGGVIWAENIRPTDADLMSEPLGARFVVGLPV
ncbi:MAG: sensor histidine kinase [Paracoccaceae bacterium]|nr:sensor histidine kinase [Paracoccaceae bacterium]